LASGVQKHESHGSDDRSWLARRLFQVLEPSLLRLALALALVAAIAWVRAPFTKIPDALFVSDGFGYYIYLPSVFIDHDLDLSNQITRVPYEGQKPFFRVATETGRCTNQFPAGSAALWSPFFLAADVSAALLAVLGVPVERTGFGYWYELPVYLGSAAFGLVALALTLRSLRQMFPPSIALASLFGVTFATPLAYYCLVEPNMSHAVAMFTIALWLWRLHVAHDAGDARWSTWITLGILLGLVALVRPYNGLLGLVAVPVALVASRASVADTFPGPRGIAAAFARLSVCCLAACAVFSLQMGLWKTLYGHWLVIPKGSGYESMSWLSPTLGSYLSSVFVFSPWYAVGAWGLILGGCLTFRIAKQPKPRPPAVAPSADPQQDPRFALLVAPWMLVVLLLISAVIAASRDWNLGTAFGQRRLVDWSVFFAFGAALILSVLARRAAINRLAEWVVVCLAGIQSCLAVVYLWNPGLLPEYGRMF
jgi:hypothetical protein